MKKIPIMILAALVARDATGEGATLDVSIAARFRSPLAKRPWSEVSLPARAFFVPATVVAMGRRYRTKRGR